VGIEGGCPAEKDNAGCFYSGEKEMFKPAEVIANRKEFCNCTFRWLMPNGTCGESLGKTLPAYPEEVKKIYPKEEFTVKNAAQIPCRQVLGTYVVKFDR